MLRSLHSVFTTCCDVCACAHVETCRVYARILSEKELGLVAHFPPLDVAGINIPVTHDRETVWLSLSTARVLVEHVACMQVLVPTVELSWVSVAMINEFAYIHTYIHQKVRDEIGAFACPEKIHWAPGMKTFSHMKTLLETWFQRHHLRHDSKDITWDMIPKTSLETWFQRHHSRHDSKDITWDMIPKTSLETWFQRHHSRHDSKDITWDMIPKTSLDTWFQRHHLTHDSKDITWHMIPKTSLDTWF
jgi:hypothetical protein